MKRFGSDGELEIPSKLENGERPKPAGLVVLITGGSGGVGCEIAKLVYSHWPGVQEVRLLDRVPPQQSLITSITGYSDGGGKPRVSYYPGDVLKADDLRVCFTKTDVVFHCAGVVDNGSVMTRKKMKKVNVEGSRNVIDACLDCGVQALVFTGSLAQVYSASSKPVRFDESFSPPHNAELLFPHYGGSKRAAEMLVLGANERTGKDRVSLHTCSLRCPPMYGESDTQLVPSALKVKCCGFSVRVGSNTTTMQSVYIGNAAWAHVRAAQKLMSEDDREKIAGNFYYIGDDSPAWPLSDYHGQFLKRFGIRQLPLLRVPVFVLMILAYIFDFFLILLAFVRVDGKTVLNRSSVRFLKLSHSFSWDKARKDLQYEPMFDRNAAIARSVEYYRQML